MSTKPIFLASHPRACSSAFERMFMTRTDLVKCVHEPFSEAFYLGPERLSKRFTEAQIIVSGSADKTYKMVMDQLDEDVLLNKEKRLFIKDMAYFLVPPDGEPALISPSFQTSTKCLGAVLACHEQIDHQFEKPRISVPISNISASSQHRSILREPGNPTVIPLERLKKFHFTFLIRHPRLSIPSYYRCTIPPLSNMTGVIEYQSRDAGYAELRRFFEFLLCEGVIGPSIARGLPSNNSNGNEIGVKQNVEICVIDAEDLLRNAPAITEAYCKIVNIPYSPDMLRWESTNDHLQAKKAFQRWKGFHEDAINSQRLLTMENEADVVKTVEQEDAEWVEKYGDEGGRRIRAIVNAHIVDYEYLKQFALKVG